MRIDRRFDILELTPPGEPGLSDLESWYLTFFQWGYGSRAAPVFDWLYDLERFDLPFWHALDRVASELAARVHGLTEMREKYPDAYVRICCPRTEREQEHG
jgi:hypothetical protein